MIDYTKIQVPDEYRTALLQHPALSFERPINEDTFEISGHKSRIATTGSMCFEIFNSGRIVLSGSWHKHHQNGRNCEDFTLAQFTNCVLTFCQQFSLDPARLHLLQLETGVNIRTIQNPDDILKHFVCNLVGEAFSRMRQRKGKSIGIELYRDEYGCKIYNKGKQYSLPDYLLRFEVKMISGKYFRRHEIQNLSDLMNVSNWHKLAKIVVHHFDELIVKEPSIRMKELTAKKREFVILAGTSGFWLGKKPQQRFKERARLKKLTELHAAGNLKNNLHELIQSKTQELIDHSELSEFKTKKGDVFPEKSIRKKTGKGLCFTTSYNVGNHHNETQPELVRNCQSCGRDISNQRKGSKFCSETKYGKAGKQCRNMDGNPRNNFKRALLRIISQLTLFDQTPFLRVSPK